MIYGICQHNSDEYAREEWPRKFVAVPAVGDRVQSTSSERTAKVLSITHCTTKPGWIDRLNIGAYQPYILITLGKIC